MDGTDLFEQNPVPLTALTLFTHRPVVVPAATDLEDLTHPRDTKLFAVSSDKGVLHLSSLAKYAAAFFKMSRSSLTCSNSRLSRATSSPSVPRRPLPGNRSEEHTSELESLAY